MLYFGCCSIARHGHTCCVAGKEMFACATEWSMCVCGESGSDGGCVCTVSNVHKRICPTSSLVSTWMGKDGNVTSARSHTRTVVRECCKGDDESQWERGKFDPRHPKTP